MKIVKLLLASSTVFICLLLLYFLMTTELFSDRLDGTKRIFFSVFLALYASFRIYKLVEIYKSDK